MKKRVRCPGCKIALGFDTLAIDRAGICPECGHLVLAPARGADDEPESKRRASADQHAITEKPDLRSSTENVDELPTVRSLESKIEDLQWDGKTLARDHNINLEERLETEFTTKAQLDERLADLKRDMPEVLSGYQPSGKMPASAFGSMLLGTGAAVMAALAAESIIGAIAGLIIGLILLLNVALGFLGCIWCFAAVFGVIFGVLAYLAPFFCGGWAAAWVITAFGRMGKNRSQVVACLLSTAASGVSIGIWWLAFTILGGALDPNMLEIGSSQNLVINILLGVGGIVSLLTGWFMAASFVQAAKFCEECEEFMEEKEMKALGVGGVKGMVQALNDQKISLAASMLCCKAGEEGKVTLFACPHCNAGFVDVQLTFKAQYEQDGKQDHEEFWLVGSLALSDTDVTWFRIFKEHA